MKALLLLLVSMTACAGEAEDSALFRHRFQSEARWLSPQADARWLDSAFFVPDENLTRALHAGSVAEMLSLAKGGHLATLAAATAAAPAMGDSGEPSYQGRSLTIVVVPGVLAEFVKTRSFEEIIERPSPFRDDFSRAVAAAKAAGNPAASDASLTLFDYDGARPEARGNPVPLDELLSVGELDVHGARVRVVLFNTPFASLESIGSTASRAAIFKRRLEKYLALTGAGPLALAGYSRGTPLALEMLAQGKRDGSAWVTDVKAMISLSGVVLGSALADAALDTASSSAHTLLTKLNELAGSLEKYPEGQNPGWVTNRKIIDANEMRWARFGEAMTPLLEEMGNGISKSTLEKLAAVDPHAPLGIVTGMWAQLGLNHPHVDYNRKVDRFRFFVRELGNSVIDLSTAARIAWFVQNPLPLGPVYYAVPSAMADPAAGEPEKTLFLNPLAYAPGSFDDELLRLIHHAYGSISGQGLNDSQVSSIQEAFSASVIESLNPADQGIKTKFLGVAGTHHWGLTLREVNHMKRGGLNGFPREALLRALAVQVLEDNR